ncbi:hypothetical protein EJB05_03542, partial [Eragrostis curvula]
MATASAPATHEEVDDSFAVFTGVELLPRREHGDKTGDGNGNGKFRMIYHKSMIHRTFGGCQNNSDQIQNTRSERHHKRVAYSPRTIVETCSRP